MFTLSTIELLIIVIMSITLVILSFVEGYETDRKEGLEMFLFTNTKGIDQVAEESGNGVKMYYDIKTDTVSTKANKTNFVVCEFLRKNEPEEIRTALIRYMNM